MKIFAYVPFDPDQKIDPSSSGSHNLRPWTEEEIAQLMCQDHAFDDISKCDVGKPKNAE